MSYLCFWFLQDFLQVFLAGNILVPEYFLLFLLYRSLSTEESFIFFLWIAFAGGLLWDIRWTGLIGLTSGIYVSGLIMARWVWSFIPDTGKTGFMLSFFIWFPIFFVSLARLIVWGMGRELLFQSFMIQQACIIPVLVIFAVFHSRKVASDNA